ncbi:MAG: alpha/beta fold hydrolase [Verrucomicrobia bacterium]|nr:alpha/beta fold hydrolase [Verrucomicrobiota bacterium]
MKLLRLLLGSLLMVATASAADTVVLLHGLGRTGWSMSRLASVLERDGYRVVNLTYPSRSLPLESLARDWLPQQLRAHGLTPDGPDSSTPSAPRVHFVTHSMGGIVVRLWLRDCGAPANLGRVVMLAPPNSGSELTDRLNAFPPFRWFTGVNGRRLGTRPADLPRSLGPWPASASASAATGQLGIIAGDRSLNPLFSSWLPGPSDGKVTVASTRLAGMTDHTVLPFSHTWLGWHAETARQIRAFLRDARFRPGD